MDFVFRQLKLFQLHLKFEAFHFHTSLAFVLQNLRVGLSMTHICVFY